MYSEQMVKPLINSHEIEKTLKPNQLGNSWLCLFNIINCNFTGGQHGKIG